jgi:light-regulated signal transduction histidine kinase (bacteriophytochrome)
MLKFEHRQQKGSEDQWFDVSVTRLEDSIVVTSQNITKLRSATEELRHVNSVLRHKNEELESMNEQLSTFAFIASHDLREPLRKIHFFANAIRETDGAKLSEKASAYFDKIINSINRMNSMISDVLKFSRANSNVDEFTTIDLNKVLIVATNDLSEMVKEKNAQISCNTLPTIKGNQTQLIQLFENLIGNALKFQKAGVRPEVDITGVLMEGSSINHPQAELNKSYVRLEFCDNGIGFDEQYLPKIFLMFQRLHGKAEYPGTGMGLAICKKIVENHRGFLVAKSEPGKGAKFTCYFPVG